jgi:hypothetical protein
VLQERHVAQSPGQDHAPETPASRRREAIATVQSAFSRPPRQHNRDGYIKPIQLPTSVREVLVRCGQTFVARVLDGLLSAAVKPGRALSEREIKEILTEKVGRYSILRALKATYSDGSPIFQHVKPSPQTPPATPVASEEPQEPNKKCFLFRVTEPDKNPRGRPPTRYIMPDIREICAKLGVRWTKSDPIESEDLCSSSAYRQAMHREFIRRRPGHFLRGWLARRLGVSLRTCQRYHHRAGVKVVPQYLNTPLHWHNLNEVPVQNLEIMGLFLKDETGKRYPPLRKIAAKLLAKRHTVTFSRQDRNYYWVGDEPPHVEIKMGVRPDWQKIAEKRRKSEAFYASHRREEAIPAARRQTLEKGDFVSTPQPAPSENPPDPQPDYAQPLPDWGCEIIAKRLYREVMARAKGDKDSFSLVNARRVVDIYDIKLVQKALYVLGKRSNVRNVAGFVVTFLRSTAKFPT